MNAREIYDAIQKGGRDDIEQVLFELLSIAQANSTANLELAGYVKLEAGKDPLSPRSRNLLSEFLEIPR